jgi:Zn-dependent peptidase ImmA (M78 family)/DNA-binding XRE family transcriptional regulator
MTEAPPLNPRRLELARRRRGLTQVELSKRTGISARSLTAYEAGVQVPTPESCKALDFPLEFLFGDDLDEPTAKSASFRAYTTMTARERDRALGAGALALEVARWIDARFNLPTPAIPDLHGVKPEAAAEALRDRWDIGERPIKNTIHLLEAHGVRVFSLSQDTKKLNAFSHWQDDVPFVFLNTMKSAESGRFDACHELGHLALHQHGGPQGRDAEIEADRFAAAFLMPRADVLAHANSFRYPTVATLVKLKKRWNVSAFALVRRLSDLDLITEWSYRTLCIELSKQGARTSEPEGGERETSQVMDKVFASLRAEQITKHDVARELMIPVNDLEEFIFGLVAISSLSGAAEGKRRRTKPDLRLV